MNQRTIRSTVTFSHPFVLSGYDDELPAGGYGVIVEEELLQGLSFEAYRRTATYLLTGGQPGRGGTIEMRLVDPMDLEAALLRDHALSGGSPAGASSPE